MTVATATIKGPPRPDGVEPVVRFKNPQDGEVVVDDLIRGNIVIRNTPNWMI
jgi:glutamyl-tRNA synthetase